MRVRTPAAQARPSHALPVITWRSGRRLADLDGRPYRDLVAPAGAITLLFGAGSADLAVVGKELCGCGSGLPASVVLIDGEVLSAERLVAWRAQCAFVPASTLLVNGTLAQNLRLSAPEASDEQLWAALAACGLLDVARSGTMGLQDKLSPAKSPFTPLELRRFGLARALLRRPSLLVYEVTADVDGGDAEVERILHSIRGRSTVVIVSHDLQPLAFADQVALLQDRAIVECGPVDERLRDSRSQIAWRWAHA